MLLVFVANQSCCFFFGSRDKNRQVENGRMRILMSLAIIYQTTDELSKDLRH